MSQTRAQGAFQPDANFRKTRDERVGYLPRKETPLRVYEELGFMSGLEVHQQLRTEKKLFCHCPAGIYQKDGQFDAELIRHMRPTLSELGEYDGTALMEFKTRKNIIYRIANVTTCTYDVDDTPPFKLNPQAMEIALEIALLLKTKIVGEIHITRKQYLDGSIPTGFQRTAIVGIEGQIPLKKKTVRIIQLSLEEDACREVSDSGHVRVYTTDRLGMPLVETVTYPDMKTPDEVAEAGQYIRFLTRSTGKVRTGIGAARQDVNVSIHGGTRVEIKGVAHITWFPELTHNEAFRQKSLLEIRSELLSRMPDWHGWRIRHTPVTPDRLASLSPNAKTGAEGNLRLIAVNLPGFAGILSFFTQPGRGFADEISDRLKVIACLEKPNMTHSEEWVAQESPGSTDWNGIRRLLNAGDNDAQILLWAPNDDVPTALDVIEERCRLAFDGVPNETRKSFPDGTTMFERVLPGPDRMYPDTDSAPISIGQELIDRVRNRLPIEVEDRIKQMRLWDIPEDAFPYLLRNNLVPLLERISNDTQADPKFVATLIAHRLKHLQGRKKNAPPFPYDRIYDLFAFLKQHLLQQEIVYEMLPVLFEHPNMDLESVLITAAYRTYDRGTIVNSIPQLKRKFAEIKTSADPGAETRWIMKQLRKMAVGNVRLSDLSRLIGGAGEQQGGAR